MSLRHVLCLAASFSFLAACGPQGQPPGNVEVPKRYEFKSRFGEGDSVAYTGQTFRHVLIAELKAHIDGLTARIDNRSFVPTAGQVTKELSFYLDFDAQTSGDVALKLASAAPTKQKTYKDLSASGAKLKEKLAGNDPTGQHKDWKTQLRGWPGQTSAEGLVQSWFQRIEQLAIDRANGNIPKDPSGAEIGKVYVTAEGHDLKELVQKFLDGAIGFSQATDKYLDDDLAGQGLLADNTQPESGKPYTRLEHFWDEGFGYFGAARHYGDFTDEEIAAAGGRPEYQKGYHDANGDGAIDLLAEYNFGQAVYAAKRDLGSAASAKTDLTAEAWGAFLKGRAIITSANGALTDEKLAELKAQRDQAVLAWEKVIAASVVHYLNQVLGHMSNFGTASYKFVDHAKHWSEMKGLALAFQFNPRSRLSGDKFDQLHARLGSAPVLPNQPLADAYKQALREARDMIRAAYDFAPVNVGDVAGQTGW